MKKLTLLLILLSVFRFEINSQEPNLQSGLVAYYPFNGNTLDSTGNSHHSTSNGVSFTTDRFGRPGSAAYFNGQLNSLPFNGYYIESPNSTIAFWVKPDAGTDTVFVNTTIKTIKIILRIVNSRYRLEVIITGKKFTLEDSPVNPGYSEYDFIAIQFDTQIIRSRQTNIIGFSVNSWHNSFYVDPEIMTVNYLFPRPVINNPVYYFKGKVDDARIFSKCLTMEEVITLYNDRIRKSPSIEINDVFFVGHDYAKIRTALDLDKDEILDYGICWSKMPQPDTSDYTSRTNTYNNFFISDLIPGSTYFVRAFVIIDVGIKYSNEVNFTTSFLDFDTIADIDGNLYKTVKIGAQTWMAENLRTTRYADGEPLKLGHDSMELIRGKYYFSNPNLPHCGYYYTWGAATNTVAYNNTYPNGVQGACPDGWLIPSKNDYNILVDYLGGPEIAGKKLRVPSNEYWYIDYGNSNESGFSAKGCGYKLNLKNYKSFQRYLETSIFWTSESRWRTPSLSDDDYYPFAFSILENSLYTNPSDVNQGLSVRCIKDTTFTPENSKKFDSADSLSFDVFPNPAIDVLYLPNIPEKTTVTIYDSQSRVRLKSKVVNGKVNISTLPKGIYFIHIDDGTNKQKGKFVK